jgi:hypothetical protein
VAVATVINTESRPKVGKFFLDTPDEQAISKTATKTESNTNCVPFGLWQNSGAQPEQLPSADLSILVYRRAGQ